MMRWLILYAVMACACPSKPASGPGGGSQAGSGTAPVITGAKTCADVKAKIEQLYRAEAQIKEPKRVEDAVADNTAMVMADCAKDPAAFVPCLAKAQSIAELENQCLVQLDDEGTEGEKQPH